MVTVKPICALVFLALLFIVIVSDILAQRWYVRRGEDQTTIWEAFLRFLRRIFLRR
ncbi:MAG: hypothetical protein ACETWB_02390 [Anaerolineae bacterium]